MYSVEARNLVTGSTHFYTSEVPETREEKQRKAELKRQARCRSNQAGVVEGQDTGADIARQEQGAELGAGQSLPLKSYTKKKPQPFFTIDKDYN